MVPVAAQRLRTDWLRRRPYPLQEIAEIVPFGWRRPVVPSTGIGRNCSLFEAGMKWAGSPVNLGVPVVATLMAINAEVGQKHGKPPLDAGEVSGIAKSVERYRTRWIAAGRFYTEAERSAWGHDRGVRSGQARRKRTKARDREIVRDRVAGMSLRTIAAKHGIDYRAAWHVLNRDAPLLG